MSTSLQNCSSNQIQFSASEPVHWTPEVSPPVLLSQSCSLGFVRGREASGKEGKGKKGNPWVLLFSSSLLLCCVNLGCGGEKIPVLVWNNTSAAAPVFCFTLCPGLRGNCLAQRTSLLVWGSYFLCEEQSHKMNPIHVLFLMGAVWCIFHKMESGVLLTPSRSKMACLLRKWLLHIVH